MRRAALPLLTATLLCLFGLNRASAVEETWRYTVKDPGEGWQQPDAEECGPWETGKGGFGKQGTPGGIVQTVWQSADIWLRGAIGRVPISP